MAVTQAQKLFYDWLKVQLSGFAAYAADGLAYEEIGLKAPSLTYSAEPASTRQTKYIGAPYKIIDFLFRIEYKIKGDSTALRIKGTEPLNAIADFFDGLTSTQIAAISIGDNRTATGLEIAELPSKAEQGANSDQIYSATFRLTYQQRK